MEVIIIGFSYKTVTQNKNGPSSQRQKKIYLKSYPFIEEENKILEENCMKKFEVIKSEFTSPGIPQQNGVVERGFDTLYYRMRVMMTHAGLHKNLKTSL